MKLRFALLVLFAAGACASETRPPGERDGQVLVLAEGEFIAWDARSKQWLSPEAVWHSFAERRRGKIWPSGDRFPPYRRVREHDTFLLQLETGPCLMYFFHTRWRRANDVWRWGPEFNGYGGCPNVFDRNRRRR